MTNFTTRNTFLIPSFDLDIKEREKIDRFLYILVILVVLIIHILFMLFLCFLLYNAIIAIPPKKLPGTNSIAVFVTIVPDLLIKISP